MTDWKTIAAYNSDNLTAALLAHAQRDANREGAPVPIFYHPEDGDWGIGVIHNQCVEQAVAEGALIVCWVAPAPG